MGGRLLHFKIVNFHPEVETKFMAYKKKYALVAVAGIVIASGAAWWMQHRGAPAAASGPAAAGAPAPAASGTGQRAPAVEVAKVEDRKSVV